MVKTFLETEDITIKSSPIVLLKRDRANLRKEFGITGGWVFINSTEVRQPNGYTFGLRGGVLLNPQLWLTGELQYLGLILGYGRDSSSVEALTVKPPTPDYSLNYVTSQKPTIQLSIGFEYYLMKHNRINPYIGLSLLAQSELESKSKYIFRAPLTASEAEKEEYIRDPKFALESLRIPVGVDVVVARQWKLKCEAAYDYTLRPLSAYRPAWNLKTGIFYQF